ncbi:MAG TPA: hypothetical protein VLQ93_06765 [Myxococcaceae bacterium]|nr:hypothetical protein [Myxococcaceae bacterium]
MRLLFRLMALLLVLMTGGVLQTLTFASTGAEDCADEEVGGSCDDCSLGCALCLCCPLRASAPTLPQVEVPAEPRVSEPVLSVTQEPVLSGVGADIFQPPIA